MPDSSAALPLPAPDAGINNSPNLSIVPPIPKRRSPSALNQAQQRSLQRTKQIIKAAQDPAHAMTLSGRGINAAFVNTLLANIVAAEACVTNAVACTDKKEGATLTEHSAEATLLSDLRIAQAAARQAYFHTQPARLQDYFVGERIEANRATLDQVTLSILTQLNNAPPPGIDSAFIAKLQADHAAWVAAHTMQAAELGKGKTERELRDAGVNSIKERAQQIQFAADSAWPAVVPGNGGVRRQFLLPITRPFAPSAL